jgi:hypothetical protein
MQPAVYSCKTLEDKVFSKRARLEKMLQEVNEYLNTTVAKTVSATESYDISRLMWEGQEKGGITALGLDDYLCQARRGGLDERLTRVCVLLNLREGLSHLNAAVGLMKREKARSKRHEATSNDQD